MNSNSNTDLEGKIAAFKGQVNNQMQVLSVMKPDLEVLDRTEMKKLSKQASEKLLAIIKHDHEVFSDLSNNIATQVERFEELAQPQQVIKLGCR